LECINLELTVKRSRIPIVPESSKQTVGDTDLAGVGAVILAAGASTRMGVPKQLLQFGGETMLRRAASFAIEAGCRPVADALQVAQQFRGETLKYPDFGLCPKASLEGRLYRYQDDKIKAQAAFERARTVAERLVGDAPDNPGRHAALGVVLAGLGRKEDAINEGKKAVELLPESKDAVDGPKATVALAEIYAWVGEHDEAFRLLEHLLTVPNGLTVPLLKLDPIWDPLRSDPRFQALVNKYDAKA
jgi:serine/threonine-protein kinase